MFGNLFARFKVKVFVKKQKKYYRVIGPATFMASVKGIGGHILIGEEFELVSTIYYSGSNDVSSWEINGVPVSEMELRPINDQERSELNLKKEKHPPEA